MRNGIIALSLAIFLLACSSDDELAGKIPFKDSLEGIKAESFGVEYIFSDSARVNAQLIAGHVIEKDEGEEGKKETIHYLDGGVKVNFLNAYGQATSKISSVSGVYNRKGGIAELNGSVVLTNHKGERLETEQLFWDEKKDSVFTDKFVRIETPDRIITGQKGMRANTDFTAWTIIKSQGEVEVEDEN